MPWKFRKGRPYFYLSKRVGGRVVSQYVGPCEAGEMAEAALRETLLRRKADARRHERDRSVIVSAEVALEEVDEAIALLARASLLAAGYHCHHRGEWRKWREARET